MYRDNSKRNRGDFAEWLILKNDYNTNFELDMLQMEDFITAALSSLLNSLSVPVFLLFECKITIEEAIDMVILEILTNILYITW